MSDADDRIRQLHQELDAADTKIASQIGQLTSRWQLRGGPVRISAVVSSGRITWVIIVFNTVCLVLGAVLIISGGATRIALGIAIVVGAVFSFGAFLTQFWAVAVTRELETGDRLFADSRFKDLKLLINERERLSQQISDAQAEQLPPAQEDHPSPG